MNRKSGMQAGQVIGTMAGMQVIGLDIAKHVFQLHSVDMGTGEIINRPIKRAKLLAYFVNHPKCLIAMEACGGAHHWARSLGALGHEVRLLHAKQVRAFVPGNKTDATDARAIWLAAQQGDIKFVGIKSVAQQATLTLHRQRELLMKMRIMQTNALRGLLQEFGASFSKGHHALLKEVEQGLRELSAQLPQVVVESLREQLMRIQGLDRDIGALEQRLRQQLQCDEDMRRIAAIPGVGLLTATAAIATMGQASAFASGREFCAWLGLVPQQSGTGGKVRLGHLSKRGDTYLRTLLIAGARSVAIHAHASQGWLHQLQQRRPANVAVVAQAAKMARTIWALTAKQQAYQASYKSARPLRGAAGAP